MDRNFLRMFEETERCMRLIMSDEARGLSTHGTKPEELQPDVHAVNVSQCGVAFLGLKSLARNFFRPQKRNS
jgi:hypothetical protein